MLCHHHSKVFFLCLHSKVFLHPQCSRASTGHWVWERAAGLAVTPTSAPIPASFICPFKQLARVRDCGPRAMTLLSGQADLGVSAFSKPMTQWRGHCALCPSAHCGVPLSIQEVLCPAGAWCFLVTALPRALEMALVLVRRPQEMIWVLGSFSSSFSPAHRMPPMQSRSSILFRYAFLETPS